MQFVIQGGGYVWDSVTASMLAIQQNAPVVNEFSVTRSNVRGTIAMAKLGNDPNSATNQWFFNLVDNSANLDNQNGGFTVFGKVINNGMQVVDAIAALPVVNGSDFGGVFSNLPVYNPFDSKVGWQSTNFVVVTKVQLASNSSTTKAAIYLGNADSFTVSNSGATVYGSAGIDTVTISNGVSGVVLDQNIDQINLLGTSIGYTVKQTGNLLNVYDSTGTILILKVPVQDDSNGTILCFSDMTVSAKLTGGVINLVKQ